MPNFSQTELNSIREVVMGHQLSANKLNEYAGKCQDEKLRGMFASAAQEAGKGAKQLVQML